MKYQCELVERPAQPVLSVRTRSAVENLSGALGQAYGAIMQVLGQQGQQPSGPPFVAYYNEDMKDLDIEIGFPVAQALPGSGKVQAGQIAGGKFASVLYVGPYADCGPAYEALAQWLKEHGQAACGAYYEWYLNDPASTAPAALQTQIMCPVKAA